MSPTEPTWRVIYGEPFCGWRDFTDQARAEEFAATAIADHIEIVRLDSTEETTP